MKKINVLWGIVIGNCLGVISILLLFVRTGILVKRFGVETNSITQTANQIFSYLGLMESGIGAAYLYSMYVPMLEEDFARLGSYYRALCSSMKRIAFKMCIVLIPVSVAFPFFMDRKETGYIRAALVLFLLGIRFILPYYISVADKNLLTVHGYKWLLDIIKGLTDVAVTFFEILLMRCTDLDVIQILLFGILLTVCGNVLFRAAACRLCPEAEDFSEAPDFSPEKMTGDIIFHQIGGLFNNNIDTLILSFIDLAKVTAYQAYYAVSSYPVNFINRFSEIFRAKVGLDIARNDGSVYVTFQRLLAVHLYAGIVMASVFYSCIEEIVTLWLGGQFVLSKHCALLLAVWIFDRAVMPVVYIVRDGRGLYRESRWYSLVDGMLNLFLSLVLVGPLGIEGLLLGSVLANLLWNELCNFFLVYRKVFHRKMNLYIDFLAAGSAVFLSVRFYRGFWTAMPSAGWAGVLADVLCQSMVALAVGAALIFPLKLKYIRSFFKDKLME